MGNKFTAKRRKKFLQDVYQTYGTDFFTVKDLKSKDIEAHSSWMRDARGDGYIKRTTKVHDVWVYHITHKGIQEAKQ